MNGIIHNCTHNDGSSSHTKHFPYDRGQDVHRHLQLHRASCSARSNRRSFSSWPLMVSHRSAKMNQQRARRFRTALSTLKRLERRLIREGVEMPKEDPFDSAIVSRLERGSWPRLTRQLKYFISARKCHGRSRVARLLRLCSPDTKSLEKENTRSWSTSARPKAQPDYDPNVRHCLYGLDADLDHAWSALAMILTSVYLREEVTFGRQSKIERVKGARASKLLPFASLHCPRVSGARIPGS